MALQLASAELAGDTVPVPKIDLREEMKKLVNTKAGGAYIPPHRLRAMMENAAEEDQAGAEFQRLSWEALRKSINGLINKVNVANIKLLVPEVRSVVPPHRSMTDSRSASSLVRISSEGEDYSFVRLCGLKRPPSPSLPSSPPSSPSSTRSYPKSEISSSLDSSLNSEDLTNETTRSVSHSNAVRHTATDSS